MNRFSSNVTSLTASEFNQGCIPLYKLVHPENPTHDRPAGGFSFLPFFAVAASQTFGSQSRKEFLTLLDKLAELTDDRKIITTEHIAPFARAIVGIDRLLNRRVGEFDMAFALPAEKQLTLAQACRFIKRALLPDSNNFKLFNQIVMLAEQAIEEGKAPEGKTRLEAYGTEHYSESHHAI